jgi:DNA polymerase-3 subunit gamma/tau
MKDGADARTQLELALVKAADPARDPSVKALMARLERLERGTPAAPPVVHAPERPATAAGQVLAPAAPATPAIPVANAPVTTSTTVLTDEGPAAVAAVEIPADDPADPPAIAVAIAPADGELDVTTVRELWPAVLDQLSAGPLGAFLAEATPMHLDGETLTVAFSESAALFLRQADRPANRDAVSTAVRAVTGRALRLAYELRSDDELDLEVDGPPVISEDELIARFIDEFDAQELPDVEDQP